MCYIKKILKLSNAKGPQRNKSMLNAQSLLISDDNINIEQIEGKEIDQFNLLEKSKTKTTQIQNLLLSNSLQSILKNQQYLQLTNQGIQNCSKKLTQTFQQLSQFIIKEKQESIAVTKSEVSCDVEQINEVLKEQVSQSNLVKHVFGQKKYRFKLLLTQQFPKVIYKERNINIKIKLANLNGKQIKNTNIINLCLGILNDKGQWIVMNRVGDPMLKGKTQIQLYEGTAQFNKIYPKDISKTFFNGRINFIVYPKPSVLIYDGINSSQERIDFQLIEPLIIMNVTIKAKKKN